ncbi:MAG: signal peptidase I [Deltaproteobacteria bacterium]|nr:signal peptidase I [Deltaproteobacteria bacterium]
MFVDKTAYGLRVPFTTTWLVRWAAPARGQVVIFADPADATRILVKRVVAVAGDRLQWDERGLVLNGIPIAQRPLPDADRWHGEVPIEIAASQSYAAVIESLGDRHHRMLVGPDNTHEPGTIVVPAGYVFVFGDMRPLARDSRNFGPVATDTVLGRAAVVWLSCPEPLFGNGWLCDPRTIRWGRIGRGVQ